ncbi:MAG: redoxin domain-containing protein [Bacteroides sp.]|jgi:peroxiredoxin|nr:redoxin domain-containing protein [Bacteroides sp.]
MRYVKWIFVVLLISSLTSFVEKNKPNRGLDVGDIAPDFKFKSMFDKQEDQKLSYLKGQYVLLCFWASYDAQSRMQNVCLNNVLHAMNSDKLRMVSVSFDENRSIFEETIRKDQIVKSVYCFVETKGKSSDLFQEYRLSRGLTNYLLDANGVIIVKNISAKMLSAYIN